MKKLKKNNFKFVECQVCGELDANISDDPLAPPVCYRCHDVLTDPNIGSSRDLKIISITGRMEDTIKKDIDEVWDNEWEVLLEGVVDKNKKYPLNIAIFGAASEDISKKKKKIAWKVGFLIGEAGHNLIYGAGSTGIMGAVVEGYLSSNPPTKPFGSTTHYISDLENAKTEDEINLVKRRCLDGREELYKLADIIIALPGGAGTSTELERYRTYKQLAKKCKENGFPVRTWNGDLYLWKGGTSDSIVKKWDSEYKQRLSDNWQEFVKILDFETLGDVL